jgi:hypothetical protein
VPDVSQIRESDIMSPPQRPIGWMVLVDGEPGVWVSDNDDDLGPRFLCNLGAGSAEATLFRNRIVADICIDKHDAVDAGRVYRVVCLYPEGS